MESAISESRPAGGSLLSSFPFRITQEILYQYNESVGPGFTECNADSDPVPPAFVSAVFFRGYKDLWDDIGRLGIERKNILHLREEYSYRAPLKAGQMLHCSVSLASKREPFLVIAHDYTDENGSPLVSAKTTVFINSSEKTEIRFENKAGLSGNSSSEKLIFKNDSKDISSVAEGAPLCRFHIDPVSQDIITRYAAASGDTNPVHTDPAAAADAGLPGTIVHGMYLMAQMGRLWQCFIPSEKILDYKVKFRDITFCGESLIFSSAVKQISAEKKIIRIELTAEGPDGSLKASGEVTASLG